VSDDQIPFDFEKRRQKKPPKARELPKPEPPPQPSALRRCWKFLYRSVLLPLANITFSCVPQIFRNTVSGVTAGILVPMIVTALGIHYYQASPAQTMPKMELPRTEPPRKGSELLENPEPGKERNPWEATVKPE
jgi:hypothetical protein